MNIPFFMHDLGEPELRAIREVFSGPMLTTGEQVAQFESRFAKLLDVPHVLGVTSCTGALHLALLAHGIGPGDEVITTPMTFIASATSILEAGATPVFVDVESSTGNLDAQLVEAAITPRTKAILPVHLYGQMCDMRALRAVADKKRLVIIEDCAHCIEGRRDGVGPGQLGDAACFSFYATKNLTCGEGGAVAVRSREIYDRLKLLRHHGMTRTASDRERDGYKHWDMTIFGWKYNMDNIQAAILLPQLDRLRNNHERRLHLTALYERLLANIPGVSWPRTIPDSTHARHLFTIWVPPDRRDRIIQSLLTEGIGVAVNYRAIHLLTYFKDALNLNPGTYPNAERIGSETITVPFYPVLKDEQVEEVSRVLHKVLTA